MKRHDNLYQQICSLENLQLADENARKGKGYHAQIREHDQNREANIEALRLALVTRTYRTPAYKTFPIHDLKERLISCLSYIHRVLHHAVLQVIGPIFGAMFTADSYSGIKGKGTHAAIYGLERAMKDTAATGYALQMDIEKYYPSVDHGVLKAMLKRKFKDDDLLRLLDEIIDSAEGLPIGNYTSMFFSNFYLTGFDHWLKQTKGVRDYFRYMDDLVILGATSAELHELRREICGYLERTLKLRAKANWRIYPTRCGIDFAGYVSYPTHRRLRKRTKQTCARKLKKTKNLGVVASYMGILQHCDSRHLQKKLLIHEKFQRLRHNNDLPGLHRGENKGDDDPEHRNRGAWVEGGGVEALCRAEVHMAANKAQGGVQGSLFAGSEAAGSTGGSETGGLPF